MDKGSGNPTPAVLVENFLLLVIAKESRHQRDDRGDPLPSIKGISMGGRYQYLPPLLIAYSDRSTVEGASAASPAGFSLLTIVIRLPS